MKERICNAIPNIVIIAEGAYVVFTVFSIIFFEKQMIPEDFLTTITGPLGLIPIALIGVSKIVDTVTK
ncbi:MAG: hypothetical protein HFJ41_05420 [Clostridia bacterium]|nr:hypothetical protein [Clostridia bacterium]